MKYILASKSPRRREILKNIGLDFDVIVSDADESSSVTDPAMLTEELSARKGEAVADMLRAEGRLDGDTVIISADTVVVCDTEILGKPKSREDAYRMLRMLSGRSHEVVSGLALITADACHTSHSITRVYFNELTDDEIYRYIDSGEPFDKAGAYAVQGLAALFVNRIDGCYFGVVGLSVNLFNELHKRCTGKAFSEC
jgi:septum formation protein